jgi:site-specific DNA-methyltransferase (adenine-specific)
VPDRRQPTTTSSFGVSRRESHDASEFYARFPAPKISDDETIADHLARDEVWVGDARDMDRFGTIADGSVALVVTSPPYFVGKDYETAIGKGEIPTSYGEYLDMLHAVFKECVRKLEPGGRIAVNVANLGRRPYRSLSSDVITILQELGLLLRGEIIWRKAAGSTGSCAWGTYQRPGNPVLRDLTERVVIASKGRFDRALDPKQRFADERPSVTTIRADDFLEATTDVWDVPSASATRIGHPAPFPVELPERLIELYTYEADLILDPFMGSGSTAVAAVRSGRYFVGFDTDKDYVRLTEERVAGARDELQVVDSRRVSMKVSIPAVPDPAPDGLDPQARAVRDGQMANDLALNVLLDVGFDPGSIVKKVKIPRLGVQVNFEVRDPEGRPCIRFDVSGTFSSHRPGLLRTDTLWKAIGKAAVIHEEGVPLVLLTTDKPAKNSAGAHALQRVTGKGNLIDDVIDLFDADDLERLQAMLKLV